MIRLDGKKVESEFVQLDIFTPGIDKKQTPIMPDTCPNNHTTHVPLLTGKTADNGPTHVPFLTDTCPKNGTVHVPYLTVTSPKYGTLYKTKQKRERETPTQKIFDQNKKIQKKINELAHVPNMGLVKPFIIPAQNEVEDFFKANNYSHEEANKFFHHYKALGWKIQGKTPIQDWQPLVHKWMGNENRWNNQKPIPQPVQQETDLKSLQQMFLQGKKVFHLITADHFHELHLTLTDTLYQKPWQERMDQLMGSNNFTTNQLLQAYETGNVENELVKRDHPNLLMLAKRIAVINHFKAQ